jgi:3-oxoacyl-[acyl-carrier-protein] synthase III
MTAAQPSPARSDLRVTVHSANRWAVAAAVRQALRRAGVDPAEIDRVVDAVVAAETPERVRDVCRRWVRVQPPS